MDGGTGAEPGSAVVAGLSFAEKLDRLFRTMHPKDRGEFTYREVQEGIRAILAGRGEQDGSLSASYVCQLRKGRRTNPTLRQVELLAAFFKIPVTYFVGDPEQVESIDAQLSLVRVLRDHDVRDIALRASSRSEPGSEPGRRPRRRPARVTGHQQPSPRTARELTPELRTAEEVTRQPSPTFGHLRKALAMSYLSTSVIICKQHSAASRLALLRPSGRGEGHRGSCCGSASRASRNSAYLDPIATARLLGRGRDLADAITASS